MDCAAPTPVQGRCGRGRVRARDLWSISDLPFSKRRAWARVLGCSLADLPDFAALFISKGPGVFVHDGDPEIDWGKAELRWPSL